MAHSSLSNMGDSWSPRWRSLHPVLTDYEILDALKADLERKLAAEGKPHAVTRLELFKQTYPLFRFPDGQLCHWGQITKGASLSIEAAICEHMPHLWRGPHKQYPLPEGQTPAESKDILEETNLVPPILEVPKTRRLRKKRRHRIRLSVNTNDPVYPLLQCNPDNPGQKPEWMHALRCRRFRSFPDADIRFCVVREPVERFVSAVTFMFYLRGGHQQGIPLQEYLEKTLKRMETAGRPHDEHLIYQVFFIERNPSYYTHIFRMGEWARLEACLSEWVGKSVQLPHENPGRSQEPVEITPALRRRVEAFYARDYEFWGRYF